MFKSVVVLLLVLVSFKGSSQDFSALWKGYFSYTEIKDITQGNDKIYAASANAIFTYDVFSNQIETLTTINGLSGGNISTIKYSEDFELLIIGYETGLMEIVQDGNTEILSVVDILEKQSISPSLKRINHFNEVNGTIYISTDYGISVYDLSQLQFGDTYFIGDGGSQINVNQTAVFNGSIYAACGSNSGLRRATVDNPNLIDFMQWSVVNPGNFSGIQNTGSKLYTLQFNNVLHEIVNDNLNTILTFPSLPVDFRAVDNNLLVTLNEIVFLYDQNILEIQTIVTNQDLDTNFTCATLLEGDIYAGTNSVGVVTALENSVEQFQFIAPQGPLSNNAFKIKAGNDKLWVT
ncbi:MAG: ABC transporter substrate-binding protein, partial [Psychroserpens sp.]